MIKTTLLIAGVSVLALLTTINAYDPTSVYATHQPNHLLDGTGRTP